MSDRDEPRLKKSVYFWPTSSTHWFVHPNVRTEHSDEPVVEKTDPFLRVFAPNFLQLLWRQLFASWDHVAIVYDPCVNPTHFGVGTPTNPG